MAKRTFRNPRTDWQPVRNRSDRAPGSKILACAIHSTESHPRPGDGDLSAIWNWFNNPASQASSHYVIDDDGNSWQMVGDFDKAWTIGVANSWTLNYELIGHAADSNRKWRQRMPQLKKLAQHLAHAHLRHGVPLRKGKVGNQGGACVCVKAGVIRHSDVTAAGFGSHTDPGSGFPFWLVLRLARWYAKHGWKKGPAR